MASITIDSTWTGSDGPSVWGRLTHHLRVFVRARRIGRHRAARLRLIYAEMRDPHWLADLAPSARPPRRSDWLAQMSRAMGGR